MKKIFGELNLTWPKIIIGAILIGVYCGAIQLVPALHNTSLTDINVTFEVWILFGIIIILNSKSAKESALKCLVFFLISQPLIYLVQDVVNKSHLFTTYYRNWVIWTVGCVPMGFLGYFMKKDKWWGLVILTPIMGLLGICLMKYLSATIFSFPRHLATVIFCIATLIIYPLCIFENKRIKIAGVVISSLIIIAAVVINIINPPVYSTEILLNSEKNNFDDTYHAYLVDSKYGYLHIEYEPVIDSYSVHAELKKAGNTEFVIESPEGEKKVYEIKIERDTFKVKPKE